jgi:hypothetical protein
MRTTAKIAMAAAKAVANAIGCILLPALRTGRAYSMT